MAAIDTTPLMTLRALRWRVGEAQARLDLEIAAGEIVRLAGPSGSGKTTLLRVLARLHPRLGGEMLLEGVPAGRIAAHLWRRQVLYVAQNPVLFPGSAADNLRSPWTLPSRRKQPSPSDSALFDLAGRLGLGPALLAREGSLLSGGEGARICLARALLVEPRLLLADEPFAFLDPEATLQAAQALAAWTAAGPRALILVSHAALPAPLSARVLDAGALLQAEVR